MGYLKAPTLVDDRLRRSAGEVFNAKAYGAKGNAVTDDTDALLSAMDRAIAGGMSLYVPTGTYVVSGTLGRNALTGFHLFGDGASVTAAPGSGGSGTGAYSSLGTRFVWAGGATSPLFGFGDLRTSILEGFAIIAGVALPGLSGIDLYSMASSVARGASTTPTRNTIRNVSMEGVNGYLKYGIRWVGTGSESPPAGVTLVDANNDFTLVQSCEVVNHGRVAFELGHSQAFGQMFINCTANSGASLTGQAGISCGAFYNGSAWTDAIGGTFQWYGGAMGHHQTADIVFGTPNAGPCLVEGLNTENGVRLVAFPSFSSTQASNSGGPLTLRGVRWSHAGAVAADKYFIDYRAPGPLTLQNCAIVDQGAGNALKVRLVAGNTGLQTLRVQDSVIESTAADNDMYDLAGANQANSKVYISGNRRLDRSAGSAISRWTDE